MPLLTKTEYIANMQTKARQPKPHMRESDFQPYTKVRAYNCSNSSIIGVYSGGKPIYQSGAIYVPIDWYFPGERKPEIQYEDIQGLELAEDAPWPEGCIPF